MKNKTFLAMLLIGGGLVLTGCNPSTNTSSSSNSSSSPTSSSSSSSASSSSSSNKITSITYGNSKVELNEHALYVNQDLKEDQLSDFVFNSLQDCIENAQDGTKDNPTVIYLAPDVYWTDDYSDPEIRQPDDLIGLEIPQSYISLVGQSQNRDDVVIASDRGQNAGANGNFNTLGVANGFHAKDITLGNYCNIDLVYERDPSKNHTKRQEAITQAQVITKVPDIEIMDEWFFENCSIVSRLNLFSRDERPLRGLYYNCHLECTDDSIGTGYISTYVNCDFDFYSNTPCGGASFYMQSFLGCKFDTHFVGDNKTLTLCKNTKPFTFIDCEFTGNMEAMEWKQSNITNDIRNIVYNNTLNGQPLTISKDYPSASQTPSKEVLEAFKVGDEYNVYNLLNNVEDYAEWDPLNQKEKMIDHLGTWNIQFDYEGIAKDVVPEIIGDNKDSLTIKPIVLGGTDKNVTWSIDRPDMVKLVNNEDNSVTLTATNNLFETTQVCLTAKASNGLEKVLHINITVPTISAPSFVTNPTISSIENGKVNVNYALSENVSTSDINPDESIVEWYKGKKEDGSDKQIIATSTYVKENSKPYTSYELTRNDVDSYITCVVYPKYRHSNQGEAKQVTSRKITQEDILETSKTTYETDFSHLAYIDATYSADYMSWTNKMESGYWYGGYYLPSEYREGGTYSDKAFDYKENEKAFTYSEGQSGAAGRYGMQTTTQGARLVYNDQTSSTDMSLEVELSPHKTGAQGFGSAKQFLDIYFKYNVETMTGYSLRISRLDKAPTGYEDYADYLAKSCAFQLMKFENGIATPVSDLVFSTAFLPGCKVKLELNGTTLSADVSCTTNQGSEYPSYMKHDFTLSASVEANTYSGFGFQHTGTAGEGKSGNRTTIEHLKVTY